MDAKRDANSGERSRDVYIAALKTELARLKSEKNPRVADVEAELERVAGGGETIETATSSAPETATPRSKSRTTRPKKKG